MGNLIIPALNQFNIYSELGDLVRTRLCIISEVGLEKKTRVKYSFRSEKTHFVCSKSRSCNSSIYFLYVSFGYRPDLDYNKVYQ